MDSLKNIKKGFKKNIKDGIVYYTVPLFEKHVNYAFCGDVSNGLNFKAIRGANREQVQSSYKSLCSVLNMPYDNCVMTNIVHGATITQVDEQHIGMGVSRSVKLPPCDGLITFKSHIPIATTHADCMPIAFFDKNKKVGCVVHAGWRGVLAQIQKTAVEMLVKKYDCSPRDILVAIGPTIGKCCFVVDKDVSADFVSAFSRDDFVINKGIKDKIDLQDIVIKTMLDYCIPAGNITVDGRCTACENSGLSSYRRDGDSAGTMAQIMCLK